MFEVVFDYDEDHYEEVNPSPPPDQHSLVQASSFGSDSWSVRPDPFSYHRAGFEVRTYRRCRRVLMFHHIPDLPTGERGYDGLVRSTEFDYGDLNYTQPVTIEDELAHQGSTRFASFIRAVTQSGYVRDDTQSVVVRNGIQYATYLKKSLPPLEFEYSKAAIQEQVLELDAESLENLPAGFDGSTYQWVDLDGEGVSGILTEQADAWLYKPNLGDGRFGPLETVATKPSLAALSSGRQKFLDLAGDGQLDLVDLAGPAPGFFERTYDEDWEPFQPFHQMPNIPWDDPNLRFVDLDGDGHADVLITEQEVFTWYPSLAEDGFGPARSVRQPLDEERGPRLIFADGTQSIYLADMCGDGLTDLVRIRNGEVCYWPNLGYGRFGAKVTMDNAPWFDNPDKFDQRRVRLADIDGSGTNDIIYLHRDGVRLYFNQSGNRLSEARRLAQFPPVDNVSSVMTADLLGNGTACLVWSSPLPADARRPLRYIDLMGSWPAFSPDDFVNLSLLVHRLTRSERPVDRWLVNRLSRATIAALGDFDGTGTASMLLRSALSRDLNQILVAGNIHTPQIFSGIALRLATERLLAESPGKDNARRLNRLLLEDAYPLEFAKCHCAKPHLLVKSVNNLGAETEVHYAPSTNFYLKDKRDGRPWVTRLPFPVHVVERVVTHDRISGNRFVTRYAYHHGYFDGIEREFRGFGMVEQWDTEEFRALAAGGQAPAGTNIDASSHVPPVLTKTWFHSGVYDEVEEVSQHFAAEYYGAPKKSDPNYDAAFDAFFRALLPDTVIAPNLMLEEEREACRALKGSMLRQEVYAQDGTDEAEHPYTVTEQNFTIRKLQPRGSNRHGVFFTHARESISYHYERKPADPRIGHALTLEVDEYGNVLKSAAIGYGRRQPVPDQNLSVLVQTEQTRMQAQILITYTENRVTNAVETADDHRTPLPCESRTYELTGIIEWQDDYPKRLEDFRPRGHDRFTFDEVLDAGATAIPDRLREGPDRRAAGEAPDRARAHLLSPQRPQRVVAARRAAVAGAALRELQARLHARPGRGASTAVASRTACSTDGHEGRYVHTEGDANWWIPSGRIFYSPDPGAHAAQELAFAREHFFLPHRYRDPFHTNAVSTESFVTYDRTNSWSTRRAMPLTTASPSANATSTRRNRWCVARRITGCCSRRWSWTPTATDRRSPSTPSAWSSAPRSWASRTTIRLLEINSTDRFQRRPDAGRRSTSSSPIPRGRWRPAARRRHDPHHL